MGRMMATRLTRVARLATVMLAMSGRVGAEAGVRIGPVVTIVIPTRTDLGGSGRVEWDYKPGWR
jgi:hypothetical protein